jgi:hypothetical protein
MFNVLESLLNQPSSKSEVRLFGFKCLVVGTVKKPKGKFFL